MDVVYLVKYVQLVMEVIGKFLDDMWWYFCMKFWNLFIKFICKFGFELVKRLLFEEYYRVLVNIWKVEVWVKRY